MKQMPFTIFLSASIPSRERSEVYHRIPDAPINIEEAVVCLARAIFTRGGRLIFGGHPSISPLVAMVAAEFENERTAENIISQEEISPKVIIYQSEAFKAVLPGETMDLMKAGMAQIIWVPAENGEQYNPAVKGPQCGKSLAEMRQKMTSENTFDAMVCLGGMEGVEAEAQLFSKNAEGLPIFLLPTTGGATDRLARNVEFTSKANINIMNDIDSSGIEALGLLQDPLRHLTYPYAFVFNDIISKITGTQQDGPA